MVRIRIVILLGQIGGDEWMVRRGRVQRKETMKPRYEIPSANLRSGRHAQTGFGTLVAGFGALLAMIHVVFLAFIPALLANLRTILTD